MPQDHSLRSFVTCGDPRGVVECKTIRKSKNRSQRLEGKPEDGRVQKDLKMSLSFKEERKDMVYKGSTDDLHKPSSFQLMEVSRGAQKLNCVIDSWSKGMSFDSQSKDIAKDLLRGALDLQESLVMLGKLQEASQYMEKLKKKQKEKAVDGDNLGAGVERTSSGRYWEQNQSLEFQRPRLSADGTSRDCYEELRKVITESFARQNLLPKDSVEDRAYADRSKSDSSPDFASSSSTQSSTVYSNEVSSSEFSPFRIQQEKPKGPNIIAKLMGLEDIPVRPLQSTPQKRLQMDKLLNQRRPIFEIDLPKSKKPHPIDQKANAERTLDEIIETLQFKGLLKSQPGNKSKHQIHQPNAPYLNQRVTENAPPIVLIRPQSVSLDAEAAHKQRRYIHTDVNSGTELLAGKWKIREKFLPEATDNQKGLQTFTIDHRSRAENHSVRRLGKEKGAKDSGITVLKPDRKERSIQQSQISVKTKVSVNGKSTSQRKEESEKRVDKIHKETPNMGRSVKAEDPRLKDASRSRNQVKATPTITRKPAGVFDVSKNQDALRTTSPKANTKATAPTASQKSSTLKKSTQKGKRVNKPSMDQDIGCKDDGNEIEPTCENKNIAVTSITLTKGLPDEEAVNASDISLIENCSTDSTMCQSLMLNIKCHGDTCIHQSVAERSDCSSRTSMRGLLLHNTLFLRNAEEMFYIVGCQCGALRTASLRQHEMAESKLLLACANELLEYKRLQHTLTFCRSSELIKKEKTCISLEKLVIEISDGLENLITYSKLASQTLLSETVHTVLERDLSSKGIIGGTWEVGWRNGFTLDDVEQVVLDIEKLILDGIIQDMLT